MVIFGNLATMLMTEPSIFVTWFFKKLRKRTGCFYILTFGQLLIRFFDLETKKPLEINDPAAFTFLINEVYSKSDNSTLRQ